MYSGLHDMPFNAFVGLYCDNDVSMLYKDGARPKAPVAEAETERAEEIMLAFADVFNRGAESTAKLNVLKRREMERMNSVILSCALQLYFTGLDDNIRKALKRLRVRITGNAEDDINALNARLSESLRKYKEFSEDGGNDGAVMDREYFHKLMATVSVYFKFSIPNDIPMLTFCEYVNQMRESARQRANAASKMKQPQRK